MIWFEIRRNPARVLPATKENRPVGVIGEVSELDVEVMEADREGPPEEDS